MGPALSVPGSARQRVNSVKNLTRIFESGCNIDQGCQNFYSVNNATIIARGNCNLELTQTCETTSVCMGDEVYREALKKLREEDPKVIKEIEKKISSSSSNAADNNTFSITNIESEENTIEAIKTYCRVDQRVTNVMDFNNQHIECYDNAEIRFMQSGNLDATCLLNLLKDSTNAAHGDVTTENQICVSLPIVVIVGFVVVALIFILLMSCKRSARRHY